MLVYAIFHRNPLNTRRQLHVQELLADELPVGSRSTHYYTKNFKQASPIQGDLRLQYYLVIIVRSFVLRTRSTIIDPNPISGGIPGTLVKRFILLLVCTRDPG